MLFLIERVAFGRRLLDADVLDAVLAEMQERLGDAAPEDAKDVLELFDLWLDEERTLPLNTKLPSLAIAWRSCAARLAAGGEAQIKDVADELDVRESLLSRWIYRARQQVIETADSAARLRELFPGWPGLARKEQP